MSRRIATDKGGQRGPQSSRVAQPGSSRDRPNSGNTSNGGYPQLPPGFDPMQFMQQMQKMQQGGQ